jgi:glycoside/pentoside/hexuronide:cation symporter, GPH family
MTETASALPPAKVPPLQVFGYGFGDVAFSFFFQAATFWLVFFYTDVLGIAPQIAGTIYMGALLWDAMIDPAIGSFAERVRTRHGRYRPFILYGAVPVAAAFALLFWSPGLTGVALIIWVAVIHVIFRTVYAFVTIPYTTLPVRMTSDSDERAGIVGIKLIFTTGATLLAGALVLPAVGALGQGDQARGFMLMGALFASALLIPMFVTFALTREPAESADPASIEPAPTAVERLRLVAANKPFLTLLSLMVLSTFSNSVFAAMAIYHFKYNVGQEELAATALMVIAVAAAFAAPLWALLQKRAGVRTMWIIGTLISMAGLGILYLFPGITGTPMMVLFAVVGFGSSSSGVGIFSVIGDCIEYGAWKTGKRTEGMFAGVLILVQKVAAALAAGVIGMGLGAIGFVANVEQTEAAKDGIRMLFMLAPISTAVLALVAMQFYNLDAKRLAAIKA